MPASSPHKTYRVGRSKAGLGLFATEPIKRGTLIALYRGRRISTAEADRLYTKYVFELNSRWAIDGKSRKNLARYINHSCKPNARPDIVRGEIRIIATRRIEPGTEITYNYGPNYWEAFIGPRKCKCDSCIAKRRRASKLAARKRARKAAAEQTPKPKTAVRKRMPAPAAEPLPMRKAA